jgi:hypothetical protein
MTPYTIIPQPPIDLRDRNMILALLIGGTCMDDVDFEIIAWPIDFCSDLDSDEDGWEELHAQPIKRKCHRLARSVRLIDVINL